MKKRIVSLFLLLVLLVSMAGTCCAESAVSSVDCQYKGNKYQGGYDECLFHTTKHNGVQL